VGADPVRFDGWVYEVGLYRGECDSAPLP
jgi:hypothetical protein